MQKLPAMRLTWKMPLFVLGVCSFMAMGLGGVAFMTLRALAIDQSHSDLRVAADMRAETMEAWLRDVADDVLSLAHNPSTAGAMADLQSAWTAIDGPRDAYLQGAYIGRNPNPAGERENLLRADEPNAFNLVHARIHPFLREVRQRSGYYDIFLINLDGDVVYTVA
jgi:methyl-accepting chemotaxis protein